MERKYVIITLCRLRADVFNDSRTKYLDPE